MKTLAYILILLNIQGILSGQIADSLRISECLEMATERSPLSRQIGISEEILAYRIQNLNSNWLPAAGINAQALYNSETIDFSDVLPNMPGTTPSLPLDQYKVWADIHQQIYDGGATRALKEAERADHNSTLLQTETDLLNVKTQVSQVYFSLLIAQKNAEVLKIVMGELSSRKKTLQSGVNYGVVLPENLLAMDAEEINLQQKLTELKLFRKQLIDILSVLMDTALSADLILVEPVQPELNQQGFRPEFQLFESQIDRLSANQKLITSGDLPKLYAFSQVAYGRPGYNMVSDDFHTFYSIGAGMKWNFLNYGDSRRQKKTLDIQKDLIDVKRENFDNQLQIQLLTEATNIEKYDSLIKNDEKILNIRKTIATSSLSKLNNGVITSTDYLTDMNAEILARLQLENHRILRIQATFNHALIQGKL